MAKKSLKSSSKKNQSKVNKTINIGKPKKPKMEKKSKQKESISNQTNKITRVTKRVNKSIHSQRKSRTPKKQCIWLDCDPGLDDTIALIMACRDPRLALVGVSTSPGNTSLKNTTKNALDILHNCHRSDVRVVQGSNDLVMGPQVLAQHMHGSNGLGGVKIPQSKLKPIIAQDPFKVISQMIIDAPGPVVWANTGSMTNLYFVLSKYPQVKKKISKIVIMGGAIGKGNTSPSAQFNIFFDPHAAKRVFQIKGDIPIIMIPLELTHTIIAKQTVLDKLKAQKKPFADAIHEMLVQYKIMHLTAHGDQFPDPPIHDPAVIYYILQPNQFEIKPVRVQIDTCKVSYGRTNCYFSNPRNPKAPLNSIDKIGLKLKDLQKFWSLNFKLYRQIFDKDVK